MAYDILQQENPSVVKKVNSILGQMPDLNKKEKDYPFVECATYPDDIRYSKFEYTSGWHFIDTPLYADGLDAKKVGFKPKP